MVGVNRRIKIFNRMLKEFLDEYNSFYNQKITMKIDSILFLNNFREEVNFVLDDFFECNNIFHNISLCKKLNLDTIDISHTKNSVWSYLHNLYILTIETDKTELVERSKKSLEVLKNSSTELVISKPVQKDDNGMKDLNSLISDIAEKVTAKLGGRSLENIDPMEIMKGLMAGGDSVNIGGIDFSEILKTTTESIQEKVNNGQLDIDSLKNQTLGLLNTYTPK